MAHTSMPGDLPVPVDDGACDHLKTGRFALPSIPLPPTSDPSSPIDIAALKGLTIVFCYPRTGAPGETVPDEWNAIPGARGCTPQACSYRDNLPALRRLGVDRLYGLSTQSSPYQQEVRERTHLPYDLLSDEGRQWIAALRLPTIEWKGERLVQRVTLAVRDGVVERVWYPVFPSDRNVHEVVAWLEGSQRGGK